MRTIPIIVIASVLAGAAHAEAPDPSKVPAVLAKSIRMGQTYEGYLQQVMQGFRGLAGSKGYIEQADIDRAKEKMLSQARMQGLMTFLPFDDKSEGKVTAAQIRKKLEEDASGSGNPNAQVLAQVERQVMNLMRADVDGDGVITLAEMRAFGEKSVGERTSFQAVHNEYLSLAPGKRLTAADLLGMARDVFEAADTDHDTVLSETEAKVYEPKRAERPAFAPPQGMMPGGRPGREAALDGCGKDKPAANDKFVFYGTYEGTAYSTAALVGDNGVRTARITVEPGTEPLFVVLGNFRSMIWRFEGATDRVRKVVLSSTGGSSAGVTGIPKDKVTFTEPGACVGYLTKTDSTEGAVAKGVLTRLLGRAPDGFKGEYGTTALSLPSLVTEPLNRGKPSIPDRMKGWGSEISRFAPSGVVEIRPEDVVAQVKAHAFAVLPEQLGIGQLVADGSLKPLGGDQYKIVKPIPHFPEGLGGAHSVKFLLATGVPMPAGSPGHSCVISEETGLAIGNDITCRF